MLSITIIREMQVKTARRAPHLSGAIKESTGAARVLGGRAPWWAVKWGGPGNLKDCPSGDQIPPLPALTHQRALSN